ncbi:putative DMT superfamily drug/metabolite permease [Candidatus Zixiibacteriota bacterium]|nr:putative DMT superfamily drug/metabolite permease [candidate division Zixibacteria bacterium]
MSIFLLIAVVFWGFSYIAIKVSLQYLSPVELIAARFVLGGVTLGAIIWWKGLSFSLKGQFKTLLLSGGIVFVHFWIMATGMETTTATNTAWILTTAPIFIALLSFFLLKEPFGKIQIISIILATFGVVLLVSNGKLGSLDWIKSTGDWIVLGSCVTWAIYTIVSRKTAKRLDPLVATFWTIALAAVVIVPYSLTVSGYAVYAKMATDGIIAVLFLGIGCLAISFWFWSEGLARKPAGEVGIYLYLEPLFAMFGGYLFLKEGITFWLILGALFIVAGVYLSERLGRIRLDEHDV